MCVNGEMPAAVPAYFPGQRSQSVPYPNAFRDEVKQLSASHAFGCDVPDKTYYSIFPSRQMPQSAVTSQNSHSPANVSDLQEGGTWLRKPSLAHQPSQLGLDRQSCIHNGSRRPISAPVEEPTVQSIPPRRVLPFSKARSLIRPSTADLPPLPLPRPIDKTLPGYSRAVKMSNGRMGSVPPNQSSSAPLQDRSLQNASYVIETPVVTLAETEPFFASGTKATTDRDTFDKQYELQASRMEEPSPPAAKSAATLKSAAATGLTSKATTMRKRAATATCDSQQRTFKQVKKVADRSTQTQTMSGRDHTVPLIEDMIRKQIPRNLNPQPGMEQQPIDDVSPSYLDDIEAFVSRYKHRSAPQEIWQRPGYAEGSEEERLNVMNNFICESLESEDFIKLCEDVGNSWRRIGLGF
ncbi:MAG: hypothetical protein M1818_006083 [Claussenomyces sp. TS43310]|nr:MAG: hypothetical protein M1818_006083 [Claussenomyces sp. TS43310]